MLVSLEWLRELSGTREEATRVAGTLTAVGLTVDSVTPRGDDHVFDIDVPPNRPDCLGHLGIARELCSALGITLTRGPSRSPREPGPLGAARVEIEPGSGCSRFTATVVRNVEVGPSPDRVVRRLEACGLRSVNNVVDASNLVLLETGNPVHFYDLHRVAGPLLRARRASAGETLRTLDGVEHELGPEDLVIADDRRIVGLAGVMGGADTEIDDSTRDVLIEAAAFDRLTVRRMARRLGIQTDASFRFERGVDPDGPPRAQSLSIDLLGRLAGGTADSGMIDVTDAMPAAPTLTLRLDRLERLLGYAPAPGRIEAVLRGLELSPRTDDGTRFEITVPSWRVDLEREVDLIEEVARSLGYDAIPSTLEGLPVVSGVSDESSLEERAAETLSAAGFHEAYGYAMIGIDEDDAFVRPDTNAPVALQNPIAETLARLRRSILPGLLQSVDRNLRRGLRDVRLFEIGRVFHPRDHGEFPEERLHVGIAWSGASRPEHWEDPPREIGPFDMFGLVESLLHRLRPDLDTTREPGCPSAFHPGRSAVWRTDAGKGVAWAGPLHPDRRSGMPQSVLLAEIDLDDVAATVPGVARYTPIPKLTPVSRDLAVILTPDRSFSSVEAALLAVPAPAPAQLNVVDRYAGPPLASDEVSWTLRFRLSPSDETLTDDEIERYRLGLVGKLESLGIPIRD